VRSTTRPPTPSDDAAADSERRRQQELDAVPARADEQHAWLMQGDV
jgi:hypothetical protein